MQASQHLLHRGPDDCGMFTFAPPHRRNSGRALEAVPADAQAVLVHRRLSILDLSDAGRQPFCSDDGRYALVFNGEIYNYVELREELVRLGHRFRSDSDTEVLLHAFIEWGADSLTRLVGMFAFAVFDASRQSAFLARDFFGIKPLYYTVEPDRLTFASEIDVLVQNRPLQVDPQRLYEYLCFGKTDHGDRTLYADVRQLPSSHYLKIDLKKPDDAVPVRYWKIDSRRRSDLSFEEAAAHVRELFLESVRLHLRSDVPVGAALSGGIDSSAIVMAMREVGGPSLDLRTFSFIAEDERLSEERWIDLVGRAAGAKVHKIRLQPADLVRDLTRVVECQGEPFTSTSIVAQHAVFQAASREGVKVMLDGQGADEMFAGYQPFLGARFATLIRSGRWLRAFQFLRAASLQHGTGGNWLIQRAANYLLPEAVASRFRQWMRNDVRPTWLDETWFLNRGVELQPPAYARGRDILRDQLIRSIEATSLPHLLRYEDRNSMAFSIESRVPFLTPALASFALSLPEEYLIDSNGTSKAVFRAAMRGLVPDAILDRKDKIGFATPEAHWLNALHPWVEESLAASASSVPGIRRQSALEEWTAFREGRKPFNSYAWRWLNLCRWTRHDSSDADCAETTNNPRDNRRAA